MKFMARTSQSIHPGVTSNGKDKYLCGAFLWGTDRVGNCGWVKQRGPQRMLPGYSILSLNCLHHFKKCICIGQMLYIFIFNTDSSITDAVASLSFLKILKLIFWLFSLVIKISLVYFPAIFLRSRHCIVVFAKCIFLF